jgi:hypothetical protein
MKTQSIIAALSLAGNAVFASSHMDAPLITRDPSANTTDVYAFVDQDGTGPKHLVLALGVYPHQEPGIGPNKYNFDDNVLYEIHVALGADRMAGRPTLSYQFKFNTTFRNANTILQSYLGVIEHVGDASQNLIQRYTVTKVDHRTGKRTVLGTGIVPPNNQGIATPFYNQGDNGEMPARGGVRDENDLDRYTQEAIATLSGGYRAFAGQRDDGFYGDIQSIFDLLSLRNPGKDSQGGFNIHLMALEVPVSELGGDQQTVGVYATTSRRRVSILRRDHDQSVSRWIQVARQGNPLFNEGLVAIADKDLYSRTSPEVDNVIFRKYAENPELGFLINALLLGGTHPEIASGRTDLAGIFIPDLIKVDLSTPGARLTGTGGDDATTGFSRLSVFGGDTLVNASGQTVAGGWPNGRRFGDDVVDIAVNAILAPAGIFLPVVDGVSANDQTYSTVFPYESTPQNGRNHSHP